MKIKELRKRENFDGILRETLCNALKILSEQGEIRSSDKGAKTAWFEHPYFSVYVTRDFCAQGRLYLRAQYRHAPQRHRRMAQAAAVEVMSFGPCFNAMIRPAFELETGSPYWMWMPGNHRFRLFDFEQRKVIVLPKSGFSTEGITREIDVRTHLASQFDWMPSIWKANDAKTSFDEGLLEAIPFDREPDITRRRTASEKVSRALRQLHTCRCETVSSEEYLRMKRAEFDRFSERLCRKFPGLCMDLVDQVWTRSADAISKMHEIRVSLTHGDFQPGNVLILTDGNPDVRLIDWEDAGIRASIYDEMTWHLKSRFPAGLSERVRLFLNSRDLEMPFDTHPDLSREEMTALWALEEWLWLMESSSRDGIERLPDGLRLQICEIAKFLNDVKK